MTAVFRRAGGRDRVDRWVSSPFEYRAYSWKPDRKPPGPSFWNRRSEKLMSDYRRGLMQLPAGLDRLRELTAEITEPAPGEPPPTPAELARRCEAYLRDSGQFSYTLNLSIQDPLIDPVEDFLFNRRQGHCEYFATALTLMLRAAGIPSRLVSGFKGGDVNTVTGRYEVRQLHAHAWVEAWADDEWLVLDPTPAGRDATVQAMASSSSYLWTDWNNRLRSVWATATTLTQQQQKNLFYDPVMNTVRNWTEVVREQGIGRGVLPALLSFLRSPRRWFSWEGGLVAFGLGVLLLAVVSGVRRPDALDSSSLHGFTDRTTSTGPHGGAVLRAILSHCPSGRCGALARSNPARVCRRVCSVVVEDGNHEWHRTGFPSAD